MPQTRGYLHATTPCPHPDCKKPISFIANPDEVKTFGPRAVMYHEGLEPGAQFECDYCRRMFSVVAMREVTVVILSDRV